MRNVPSAGKLECWSSGQYKAIAATHSPQKAAPGHALFLFFLFFLANVIPRKTPDKDSQLTFHRMKGIPRMKTLFLKQLLQMRE